MVSIAISRGRGASRPFRSWLTVTVTSRSATGVTVTVMVVSFPSPTVYVVALKATWSTPPRWSLAPDVGDQSAWTLDIDGSDLSVVVRVGGKADNRRLGGAAVGVEFVIGPVNLLLHPVLNFVARDAGSTVWKGRRCPCKEQHAGRVISIRRGETGMFVYLWRHRNVREVDGNGDSVVHLRVGVAVGVL